MPDGIVGKYNEFKALEEAHKSAKQMIDGSVSSENNSEDSSQSIVDMLKTILAEPYNFTDPFVIFDPEVKKPSAVENYISEEEDKNAPAEKTKWDGIKYPIINLNGVNIPPKNIQSFVLKFRDFIPTLELTLKDPKFIDGIGIPSLLNHVVVIMVPQFEGLYRNIALPFYIDERINNNQNNVTYKCSVHYKGLREAKCAQIGSGPLSTFDLCSEIAKESGLGFAVTDNCQTISDARWRQVYSQKISDYTEEQLKIGGLDENSIFDAWIDGHGYLVLANLAWVFSSTIQPENLMILEKTGSDLPIKQDLSGDPFECCRMVCNIPGFPIANLFFESITPYMTSEESQDIGTLGSFWCLTDVGGSNSLMQQDIQMIDDAPDAKEHPEFYEFKKIEYIGADMTEDIPYLMQERLRKSWIAKKRAKRVILKLKEPNFGLERGMLLNVIKIDDDKNLIGSIKQNEKNYVENNETNGEPYNIDDSVDSPPLEKTFDESSVISNPGYSGIYYIDGVEFHYDVNVQKYLQFLILIKYGSNATLFNLMSGESVTSTQAGLMTKEPTNDTQQKDENVS